MTRCPECNSDKIIEDQKRGVKVCENCGLVLEETLFVTTPEWRAYSTDEREMKTRTGSPLSPLRADLGLKVQISNSRRDSQGNYIAPEMQNKFRRLTKMDNITRDSQHRNLQSALKELKRLRSQLELPEDIAETASYYYRRALKENLIRGRSIDGMVTAALYIACRKRGIPITLKDIAEVANVSAKELGRCVRIILRDLSIKAKPSDHNALIHRLGGGLKLSMLTRNKAVKIMNEAKKRGLTIGKNPMSIAAAALYIAAIRTGERRTQQEIAKEAKTTPVTIRNRFKELYKVLEPTIEQL
ncbi:MAG: transcription initiation factor IIB [Candidatus Hodarchaeales archaeon]|jgi:transcription initiation factor TFIIB